MSAPLRFHSTNRAAPPVDLATALLTGQAPDRGLYWPEQLPRLGAGELAGLAARPYHEVAFRVLRPFTQGMLPDDALARLCADAYDFPVPLEPVIGRRALLRLDRGPTASFKDFAARLMARWMSALLAARGEQRLILTATSGDTGSAVAHAYHGVPGVRVVVLFPPGEVSDRQRRQMTTVGGNVATLAIAGQFDDCQALVKRAFADPALADLPLTSANSINIGRLLPQAVYYVYAWANWSTRGAPLLVSVPSGNFGNLMGAVVARELGVPLRRLIIATNANDEVPVFLRTGRYAPIVPSRVCISSAMNVGHPSNLARLVAHYGGWLDETGTLQRPPDLDRLRADLYAISISDATTRATIRAVHSDYGPLLDPHTAVAWAGLSSYAADVDEDDTVPAVVVATAHPAKFPDEVRAATGVEPPVPPALAGLDDRPEQHIALPADYDAFRDWLLEHARRTASA
jgi:threonine synthase